MFQSKSSQSRATRPKNFAGKAAVTVALETLTLCFQRMPETMAPNNHAINRRFLFQLL
jgi:hypothetical protein